MFGSGKCPKSVLQSLAFEGPIENPEKYQERFLSEMALYRGKKANGLGDGLDFLNFLYFYCFLLVLIIPKWLI